MSAHITTAVWPSRTKFRCFGHFSHLSFQKRKKERIYAVSSKSSGNSFSRTSISRSSGRLCPALARQGEAIKHIHEDVCEIKNRLTVINGKVQENTRWRYYVSGAIAVIIFAIGVIIRIIF